MTASKIGGVLAPVLTAFTNRSELDVERSVIHCQWLLQNGCDSLVVFGTTSEANSCSVSERSAFLERLVSAGVHPERLMPGTGCCSLKDTIELTRQAIQLGCAGVLTLPPFYYKQISVDGLFQYFSQVIEAVSDQRLRLYLYHIPPISMVPIPLDLVEKLLDRFPETLAGVKDSSGDYASMQNFLQFAEKGFAVFSGSEEFLLPLLQTGGAGTISAAANVIPGTLQALYKGWKQPGSEQRQTAVKKISSVLRSKPLIPSLKAILAKARRDVRWKKCRPPLVALNLKEEEDLFEALDNAQFEWPEFASPLQGGKL
jgi:4-hydroxy-tetrahydrodipicolinate synthase